MRTLLVCLVLAMAGCTSSAERRRLVLHEAKLVLKHSVTEPAWVGRRAQCEAQMLLEDPDAQ